MVNLLSNATASCADEFFDKLNNKNELGLTLDKESSSLRQW
jgi:hypothetical protein